MTTGKKAIRNAMSTFGSRPKPNQTSSSGATATFGMACDETRSGRMERENGGQRKIASASGIPTTMLSGSRAGSPSSSPSRCVTAGDAFAMIESAMALGGGSRKAGTANTRVAASQSASSASTTPIGYDDAARTRARHSRRARLRWTLASTSSMPSGA